MVNLRNQLARVEQYLKQGQLTKAKTACAPIYRLAPKNPQVLLTYLKILEKTDSLVEVVKILEDLSNTALSSEPLMVKAAEIYLRLGRPSDAENIIIKLESFAEPTLPLLSLKYSLRAAQGKREEALNCALAAVRFDPKSYSAFLNLGAAFCDLGMNEQGDYAFNIALELKPDYVPGWINKAYVLSVRGDLDGSIEAYQHALKLIDDAGGRDRALVTFPLGLQYLRKGDLQTGWCYYDDGFDTALRSATRRNPNRKFQKPKWTGGDLEGKTILIWREQGLGDELRFSSCIPDVCGLAAQVIIECDPRLVPVYASSFPAAIVRPANWDLETGISPKEDFDFHCPVGSLMRYLRPTVESFPGKAFLKPDPVDVLDVKKFFEKHMPPGLNVGICWRSGNLNPVRNSYYANLVDWSEILTQKGCNFISLQYGDTDAEITSAEAALGIKIYQWDDLDLKNDLKGVFALMSQLDLVISVGTAVAEMSPAIGVETWLVLPTLSWTFLGTKEFVWSRHVVPFVGDRQGGVRDALNNVALTLSRRLEGDAG